MAKNAKLNDILDIFDPLNSSFAATASALNFNNALSLPSPSNTALLLPCVGTGPTSSFLPGNQDQINEKCPTLTNIGRQSSNSDESDFMPTDENNFVDEKVQPRMSGDGASQDQIVNNHMNDLSIGDQNQGAMTASSTLQQQTLQNDFDSFDSKDKSAFNPVAKTDTVPGRSGSSYYDAMFDPIRMNPFMQNEATGSGTIRTEESIMTLPFGKTNAQIDLSTDAAALDDPMNPFLKKESTASKSTDVQEMMMMTSPQSRTTEAQLNQNTGAASSSDLMNPFLKNIVRKAIPIITNYDALRTSSTVTDLEVQPAGQSSINPTDLTTSVGIVVDQRILEPANQNQSGVVNQHPPQPANDEEPSPPLSSAPPSEPSPGPPAQSPTNDVAPAATRPPVSYSFDETDPRFGALMKLNEAIRLCQQYNVDRRLISQQLALLQYDEVPSLSGVRNLPSSSPTPPPFYNSAPTPTAVRMPAQPSAAPAPPLTPPPVSQSVKCAALSEDFSFETDLIPLGLKYIDTHCHIDLTLDKHNCSALSFNQFKGKMRNSWSKLYGGCITSLCFPSEFSNRATFYTSLKDNDDVKIALGCHPHQAQFYNDRAEDFIFTRLSDENVVAYGECGLDYSARNTIDPSIQKAVLKRQLKVAATFGKPLVLHCRDAESDCFQILKEHLPHDHPIHWHSFTGNAQVAATWSENFTRLYFGVTPAICSPRNHLMLEFVQRANPNRLVVETDAPYFLPEKYKFNDLRRDGLSFSSPGLGSLVVQKIAEAQKVPIVNAFEQLLRNSQVLYDSFY